MPCYVLNARGVVICIPSGQIPAIISSSAALALHTSYSVYPSMGVAVLEPFKHQYPSVQSEGWG